MAAHRGYPDAALYRRQAVTRTLFRSPYLEVLRSVGNMLLYAGLVVFNAGRRFPPAFLLVVPLSVPLFVPGVLLHLLSQAVARPLAALLGGRISRSLRARAEDEGLAQDLVNTVASAGQQPEGPQPA